MKKLLFTLTAALITLISFAQSPTYVNGYTRSNGTYVQGHYRTTPNSTRNDNYSTIGNTNPFTGSAGSKPADSYNNNSNYNTPKINSSSYNIPTYNYNSTYSIPTYRTTTVTYYNY